MEKGLKKGVNSWFFLSVLGVSYVISGDFAGWNFGFLEAGWGGLLIATFIMGLMYFSLVLSLSELSSALPSAGGGFHFSRIACGNFTGYITGISILLEYVLAASAIAIFITTAIQEFYPINKFILLVSIYFIFVFFHLLGVGEAMKIMLAITALAVVAIALTIFSLVGDFSIDNLKNIQPTDALGANEWLPFGYEGIWAALPFAMWIFLAIEGIPLAAEESKNPATDIPKASIAALLFLTLTGMSVIIFTAGSAGTKIIGESGVPLVDALKYTGKENLSVFINILGLSGLLASFFSVLYAFSRLIYAFARDGYLPFFMSKVNKKQVPLWALIIPSIIACILSYTGQGDLILAMAVAAATISYALMSLSHIVLRIKKPDLERPFKTPGGLFTSILAFILSILALTGVYMFDSRSFNYALIFYIPFVIYYILINHFKKNK